MLSQYDHFSKALFEILVGSCRSVFNTFSIQARIYPIQINAVGEFVPEFIPAVPGIFCDVSSYAYRSEIGAVDVLDYFSAHRHNLNLQTLGYLRSCEYKYKSGGS